MKTTNNKITCEVVNIKHHNTMMRTQGNPQKV